MLLGLGAAVVLGSRASVPVPPGGWVWPLPVLDIGGVEFPPTISSGWGEQRTDHTHRGVDVVYARPHPVKPPFTDGDSAGYFLPKGTPVIAARDGVVWTASVSTRGSYVVLDHGAPWLTFYQHLEALHVPLSTRGKSRVDGRVTHVRAGESIGVAGISPLDKERIRHLHFELWLRTYGNAIDPTAAMRSWAMIPERG